jgi:phenylalanyl-tRNA synthetase beta chain
MVVVEYAYEEMKRLVDLPLERMINSLNELGAPSEYEPGVRKIITELTPNRPDWYSMEGLARALRSYHGQPAREYSAVKSGFKVIVDSSVARIRPYTACAVVTGLRFDDQRIRDIVLLQEKLLATLGRKVKRFGIGLYPLHAIKFPVRYTAMAPKDIIYAPLGSDVRMNAEQVLKTHKKGEQYGHILKGHKKYPVFMDAEERIMALIPIVNSNETGRVDESTQDIFIEVSGTDINSCKAALNILVCTFADMGGMINEVEVDYGKKKLMLPDLTCRRMKINLRKMNRTLGVSLAEKDAHSLLEKMGYGYGGGEVVVPPYRADVMSWVDVMEDLAIAYGYNNFRFTLPECFTIGEIDSTHARLEEAMRGMGFLEMKTFILTNKEKLSVAGYDGALLEISNPGSADFTVVRPNMQVSVLEVFSNNKMKGLPQKYYEIGTVHDGKGDGSDFVFGIMDKKVDFSSARGYLQSVAQEMGLGFELRREDNGLFDSSMSCAIMKGEGKVGIFGKVKKEILEKFGIGFEVFICEIRL